MPGSFWRRAGTWEWSSILISVLMALSPAARATRSFITCCSGVPRKRASVRITGSPSTRCQKGAKASLRKPNSLPVCSSVCRSATRRAGEIRNQRCSNDGLDRQRRCDRGVAGESAEVVGDNAVCVRESSLRNRCPNKGNTRRQRISQYNRRGGCWTTVRYNVGVNQVVSDNDRIGCSVGRKREVNCVGADATRWFQRGQNKCPASGHVTEIAIGFIIHDKQLPSPVWIASVEHGQVRDV